MATTEGQRHTSFSGRTEGGVLWKNRGRRLATLNSAMPRPLSAEARKKAIAATQTIVATHGTAGFSIDAVVRESGVAKTTLYRHWSSGNQLLVDAIDELFHDFPIPDNGSLRADVLEVSMTFVEMISGPGLREMVLDLIGAAACDPELAAIEETMIQQRAEPMRDIITRAIERGEIPAIDVDAAINVVEGPFIARMIRSSKPIEQAEVVAIVDWVVRGLGVKDD